jgi:UDP-N-acetylmuramoyl-tripeptide--D-alanyl-D-alanine ligase
MVDASAGQRLSGTPASLVRRVCTDSRQIQAHDLFVALSGDRFDAHAFLDEAAAKGALGLVAERAKLPARLPECAVIAVENTRSAFGRMAARYRNDFSLPVIGIGGSNGKTTTKELLRSVLACKFKTLASPGSFNNDVGVPTTLFELRQEHEVAVLEFGTNHPGELPALVRLARPQIAVIPSIGREHLEFFQDLDGVLAEEGWLAELLPADGKLYLNGDTLGAAQIMRRSLAPVVRVGFSPGNDWRARKPQMDQSGVSFEVEVSRPQFAREFRVPLLGRHQVVNALLAIAVAADFGLAPEQVQQGLLKCTPPKLRLQLWTFDDVLVLDDCYNANADSMRAALETLRDFPCHGRRVAVLGDMAELGAHAAAAHSEIGQYAAAVGVQQLFTVGSMAALAAEAARQAGVPGVAAFTDIVEAAGALRQFLAPRDVVLLKASRAAGLERIGALLRQGASAQANDDVSQGRKTLGKE